jgi:hypothetical protein
MPRIFAIVLAALATLGTASVASAQGRIDCAVTENGQPAAGTMVILQGSTTVATGACGRAATVPPGTYDVKVHIDGVLDRPDQRRTVTVRAGRLETLRTDFQTGILEVQVTSAGRRAAAQAVVLRNGTEIGTVSGGVGAHLSVGTYDVVVRYRGQEHRSTAVSIAPGERRTVSFEL